MTPRRGSKRGAERSMSPRASAGGLTGKQARGPRRDRRRDAFPERDHGAVTAEFAVALPAVLLLLALLLAGSAAGITQLRLEEAARAGARALARGDGHAAVDGIVRRLAGDAASAVVSEDGEWINVTVSARVVGPLGSLIPWSLSATASARGEAPQSSAATTPLLAVGDDVVDFNEIMPLLGLQATVKEVAA
ncbi:TadE family type IV pilus minor pilin [Arthrobacter sp. 2RAF6]|uniref:TadE family type IV pilus minor pilin n=1 Tax=Arthrobacter sp. 2RAF6 TaxID=3233002 RepID=UPI003F919413